MIANKVVSFSKRNDDLHANQIAKMERLIKLSELDTGRGVDQIGTLQPSWETRWSSHYSSICSLIKLCKPTYLVVNDITTAKGSGTSTSGRAKAEDVVQLIMSFEFVFVMQVMKELMGVINLLCKMLQHTSQDIVNSMDDVVTTKSIGLESKRQWLW